jgi:glycosyltransferase involved in cell wall biosynthesis
MQLSPTVSVVIPSYKHEAWIHTSINSVLAQDWEDFEIIITDDGSSDNTVQQIKSIKDPRIDLKVFKENRGAGLATNYGISRARGEFIAILNSDDYFAPKKLSTQVKFLRQHPNIGAVFGWPALVDEQGNAFTQTDHKDFGVFQVANRNRMQWLRQFFDHGNCLCHPTVMIRKSCYEAVGLYDARLAQVPDFDMWVRLAMQFEIYVLPEVLTYFRIQKGLQNASARRLNVLVRDAWGAPTSVATFFAAISAKLCSNFPGVFSSRRA